MPNCICDRRKTKSEKTMNKEDSLALYKEGVEAWNIWANEG